MNQPTNLQLNILFLTQIVPYPPDSGPKVKTWHVLRYLASQGHKIHLVTFVRPEEEAYIGALRNICVAVHAVPIKRSRLADVVYWLRSNFSGRPFIIERDDLPAMRTAVASVLANHEIDVIHADQLTMTQFALPPGKSVIGNISGPRPRLVFDAHNAVWRIVERMGSNASPMLRLVAALETKRVRNYEGMLVRRFDHTLAVTDIDRSDLIQANQLNSIEKLNPGAALPITVIPIAVDTDQLQPVSRALESNDIFTMGTLHYPPNADGVRWFAREVFPLVLQKNPAATLTIAGKNPPKDLYQIAENSSGTIRIVGFVPDLYPYLERAAVMVVPVRAGSGMRVRILEAFAYGMPVVTTTVGLEGIDARNEIEVIVADTPESFASAVVRVMQDHSLQQSLSAASRELVERKYAWKSVLMQINHIYGHNSRSASSYK